MNRLYRLRFYYFSSLCLAFFTIRLFRHPIIITDLGEDRAHMGNSPPTGGLLLGNGDHAYQANVSGSSAGLMFGGRSVRNDTDGQITESWSMQYKVGKSTCGFVLSNDLNFLYGSRNGNKLEIAIGDYVDGSRSHGCFVVTVQRDQAGLLHHTCTASMDLCLAAGLTTFATNAYGVTTQTICDIYGSGTRRGLVVREWKTRSKDERPCMGTVTHYFLDDENGEDVGLSVAIKKIRSCDDRFDFAVDGPHQHPADALAFMLKQVLKTRTWKPNFCLHCAHKYIDERISESESDIDNSTIPPVPSGGQRRNGGGLVSNGGKFKGNNVGNTFVNKIINGRKR